MSPISNIPSPETLTIAMNSSREGFLVILNTLLDWAIKDFMFCILIVSSDSERGQFAFKKLFKMAYIHDLYKYTTF